MVLHTTMHGDCMYPFLAKLLLGEYRYGTFYVVGGGRQPCTFSRPLVPRQPKDTAVTPTLWCVSPPFLSVSGGEVHPCPMVRGQHRSAGQELEGVRVGRRLRLDEKTSSLGEPRSCGVGCGVRRGEAWENSARDVFLLAVSRGTIRPAAACSVCTDSNRCCLVDLTP